MHAVRLLLLDLQAQLLVKQSLMLDLSVNQLLLCAPLLKAQDRGRDAEDVAMVLLVLVILIDWLRGVLCVDYAGA